MPPAKKPQAKKPQAKKPQKPQAKKPSKPQAKQTKKKQKQKKKKRRGGGNAGTSLATYRKDPMYPRIVRAVSVVMKRDGYVAPVEVLVEMGMLQRRHLVDWRHGRVPYLERVIRGSLSRLSRLLRILRFHVHDLNLAPSETAYRRHGKGRKQPLRFSKTAEPRLERAYATHFIRPGKKNKKDDPCPAPSAPPTPPASCTNPTSSPSSPTATR